MPRLARFAEDHAVVFSWLVTLAFIVLLAVLAVTGGLMPSRPGAELAGVLGRLVMALLAVWTLSAVGWLRPAGLVEPGTGTAWLSALVLLVYVTLVFPPLLTGDLHLGLDDPLLAFSVGANAFTAGVMEEIFFRGLVLYALLHHWGTDGAGLVKASVLSSFLFSAPHLLNLLTDADPTRVFAQIVWAFLFAVAFCMLVLVGRSLWPVAAVHGLGNVVVHLNRLGREAELSTGSAVLLAPAPIPMLLYTALLLRRRRVNPR